MRRAWLWAAVFLVTTCQPPTQISAEKRSGSTQPNIIFLLTDDQRADALGVVGSTILQTPHLDALAQQGSWFKRAYVTTSICAVSRASILSGQYARRHGIHDFATSFSDSAFAHTYPMLLKQAGYQVGFIGKYGIGNQLPANQFDYWRGFGGQGYYYHQDSANNPVHLTRLMYQQAREFLVSRPDTVPFCLSVSFKAPHVGNDTVANGFNYDPRYAALYETDIIPRPANGGNEYYQQFPESFRVSEVGNENEARLRWQTRFSTDERYQASVKGYYRLIAGVDQAVGRLRKDLDSLGLADNTIIIFSSDNGFYLGEYGLAGKWYGHEVSIRVPLILYDPRHPEYPRQVDALALNVDIAPTLLAMAGVEAPVAMQGRSLLPLLQDDTSEWRTSFFYEHLFTPPPSYPVYIPHTEGVVSTDRKYMRYFNGENPENNYLFETYQVGDSIEQGLTKSDTTGLAALQQQWLHYRKTLY